MRKSSQIYSIFGQIEEVAAEIMIDRELARKIHVHDIPTTQLYNERGYRARFAIIISEEAVPAFEKLIHDLRA